MPVVVGFGVRTPEQALQIGELADGVVIVPLGFVYGLDLATGRTLWQGPAYQDYGTPALLRWGEASLVMLHERSIIPPAVSVRLGQAIVAVDRQNGSVAHLYAPLHPAILRAVKHTADAAHRAGIKVSMCGEMAAEPAYAGVLMGLGLDEFSTPAMAIPRVKHVIRHWKLADAQSLAQQCLDCPTVADVQALVTSQQPEVDMHPLALKPRARGPEH